MIVCSCNVLSDTLIRSKITENSESLRTPNHVYKCLGCAPKCGVCARMIRAILGDLQGPPMRNACPAQAECPIACHQQTVTPAPFASADAGNAAMAPVLASHNL